MIFGKLEYAQLVNSIFWDVLQNEFAWILASYGILKYNTNMAYVWNANKQYRPISDVFIA